MAQKERRMIVRKAFEETIHYDVLVGEIESMEREAICIDISNNGLCFETDFPLKELQMVKVMLPIQVGITTPTLGEVRWVNPTNGSYRVGIRFIV